MAKKKTSKKRKGVCSKSSPCQGCINKVHKGGCGRLCGVRLAHASAKSSKRP